MTKAAGAAAAGLQNVYAVGWRSGMISSSANKGIKELVKLQKQSRQRRKTGLFVVEGAKLAAEAAQHGLLQRLYLAASQTGREDERLTPLLGKVSLDVVSDAVFRELSEVVTPQGVLGIVKMPSYQLETMFDGAGKRFLLLDDLRDPGNLGTMMRTAEGAGMSGVILSRESVDLFNPKVVRATMGAILRMPYCYVESLPETIRLLKERGIAVYGAAMEGSVLYDEPDYTSGAAVVIGNEARGISAAVFDELSGRIRIPMAGRLESLNAAVSAAVIMYEMERQFRKE